jgi:hypothetical protein
VCYILSTCTRPCTSAMGKSGSADLTPAQLPQSYATEEPHIDVHVIESRLEQVQDHGLFASFFTAAAPRFVSRTASFPGVGGACLISRATRVCSTPSVRRCHPPMR